MNNSFILINMRKGKKLLILPRHHKLKPGLDNEQHIHQTLLKKNVILIESDRYMF